MPKPMVLAVGLALATNTAGAQDVPGVEVCTVEKSMVRRTTCLQSNVDFLQKLISKNASDGQQKLDAASRAIDELKNAIAILQKRRIATSSGRERKKIGRACSGGTVAFRGKRARAGHCHRLCLARLALRWMRSRKGAGFRPC